MNILEILGIIFVCQLVVVIVVMAICIRGAHDVDEEKINEYNKKGCKCDKHFSKQGYHDNGCDMPNKSEIEKFNKLNRR